MTAELCHQREETGLLLVAQCLMLHHPLNYSQSCSLGRLISVGKLVKECNFTSANY